MDGHNGTIISSMVVSYRMLFQNSVRHRWRRKINILQNLGADADNRASKSFDISEHDKVVSVTQIQEYRIKRRGSLDKNKACQL